MKLVAGGWGSAAKVAIVAAKPAGRRKWAVYVSDEMKIEGATISANVDAGLQKYNTEATPARSKATVQRFLKENLPIQSNNEPTARLIEAKTRFIQLKPFSTCGSMWIRKTPARKQAR